MFNSGIQIAANNMPQGEYFKIAMSKYAGRAENAFIVVHFNDYEADVGRKSFQKPIVDFAEKITE